MPRVLTLCLPSSGIPGILVRGRGPALKGNCVVSILNLRTFANSAGVPIVVFVDMQQEYLAKPRLQAISEIDHAPDNCRRVLDHAFAGESACLSTSIDAVHRSLKAAYLRGASASHAPDDMAAEDMTADEIHRAASKISRRYGEVHGTTDWSAATLPRKLGNGRNAGG
jgi:hypothetical protein